MTNEEVRFKIEKIEKYSEQKDNEKIKIIVSSVGTGIWGLTTALYVASGLSIPLLYVGAIISAGLSLYQLKKLVEAIGKKSALEIDIEKIKEELKEPLFDVSKGMKRWLK